MSPTEGQTTHAEDSLCSAIHPRENKNVNDGYKPFGSLKLNFRSPGPEAPQDIDWEGSPPAFRMTAPTSSQVLSPGLLVTVWGDEGPLCLDPGRIRRWRCSSSSAQASAVQRKSGFPTAGATSQAGPYLDPGPPSSPQTSHVTPNSAFHDSTLPWGVLPCENEHFTQHSPLRNCRGMPKTRFQCGNEG